MPERYTAPDRGAAVRTGRRTPHPGARFSETVIHLVVNGVFFGVLAAGVALAGWLVVDAFRVSASAGTRSLCAVLLPVVASSYLRWVRADWLQKLNDIPNLGLMVGAAAATVALLTALSADPGSKIIPELGISLAFSSMLLARTDVSARAEEMDAPEDKLTHFFFGIAFALLLYGLFTLEG
jgi:hypothetical protein